LKTFNKILIGMAAVTTVLAPLAPKNFSLNINLDAPAPAQVKERSYTSTDTQCDLTYKTITDNGLQVCEYHCRNSNKATVFKTFATNAAVCPATTTEKLKDYQ
jgi:hypothetical protein